MISRFKQFLEQTFSDSSEKGALPLDKQLQIATAALFVEMTSADFSVLPEEKKSAEAALVEAFNLNPQELLQVMSLAEDKVDAASCLHEFTHLINQHFSSDKKFDVIKLLWRVAYADGQLDKYEEHLIRKVADLIHVSHTQMIKAKHAEKPRSD